MPEVTVAAIAPSNLRTLAVDIGGTGIKALVLGADGRALTERVRVETPRPATPVVLVPAIVKLVEPLGAFDRISIGFPGVVIEGVTLTAPNLHKHGTHGTRGSALRKDRSERTRLALIGRTSTFALRLAPIVRGLHCWEETEECHGNEIKHRQTE